MATKMQINTCAIITLNSFYFFVLTGEKLDLLKSKETNVTLSFKIESVKTGLGFGCGNLILNRLCKLITLST